jgi:FkbM family methyltransferase
VEPEHSTYDLLLRNHSANPGLRWFTYRAAMWKDDGEVALESQELSTSSRITSGPGRQEIVPAISLPTLIHRVVQSPVSILKIDIEGAEEVALSGHHSVLSRVAHVIAEVHPQLCNSNRVIDTLRLSHAYLYRVPGRRSSKPLLLSTNRQISPGDLELL